MRIPFEQEVQVFINDNVYLVNVEGFKFKDKFDGNYYTEFKRLSVSDTEGNPIDKDNEDYIEVIENAMDNDFEVEYEEESFDGYWDCEA